jgi:transcriptional regulator with XRE-family HTH domain
MSPTKYTHKTIETRFFGRVIKKWRLTAGLSQGALAANARLSVTILGCMEREKGFMSDDTLLQLCLGLELELGRPMLEQVFVDAIHELWEHLRVSEAGKRAEWQLEAVNYTTAEIGPEYFQAVFDDAYEGVKRFTADFLRALDVRARGKGGSIFTKTPSEAQPLPPDGVVVRVRKVSKPK